jgi:hypothetical protein
MKKNQNPLPKPPFALPTFNRCLKLMALALVSLVAGVENTNAQTPAIVGRAIVLVPGSNEETKYLTQEQYQAVISRKNTNYEWDSILGTYIAYQGNELKTFKIGTSHLNYYRIQDLTLTNNGLMTKHSNYRGTVYGGQGTVISEYFKIPVRYKTEFREGSPITIAIHGGFLYVDFNELSVNRAMSAAPIGTLKVTPSNNASEQTKVQWSVE